MDVDGAQADPSVPSGKTWTSRIIKLPQVSERVGHGLIQHEGKLYMIGGGSEEGEVKEILELELDLNLDTVSVNLLHVANLPGLYEFSSNKYGNQIWIFGGSDQSSTKNDIYSFDLETSEFQLHVTRPEDKDDIPPPRTQFGNKCFVEFSENEKSLVVFGGGAVAENAVKDNNLYLYNVISKRWKKVVTSGHPPAARQGHVMASVGTRVFIHGGLTGTAMLFDDVHMLDLAAPTPSWTEVENELKPPARAAHNVAVIGTDIYIYGGLSSDGSALPDLWRFDTESLSWSQIYYIGNQSPRLDFGMCSYTYNNSIGILLHGGVDPGGYFFQDFLYISTCDS